MCCIIPAFCCQYLHIVIWSNMFLMRSNQLSVLVPSNYCTLIINCRKTWMRCWLRKSKFGHQSGSCLDLMWGKQAPTILAKCWRVRYLSIKANRFPKKYFFIIFLEWKSSKSQSKHTSKNISLASSLDMKKHVRITFIASWIYTYAWLIQLK